MKFGTSILFTNRIVRRVLVLLFTSSALAADPSFRGLGDLPGGPFSSAATGVSDDGKTVCGAGNNAHGYRAFRWSLADGMIDLGVFDGGQLSDAFAISPDGAVIVGTADKPGDSAFRQIGDAPIESLGTLGRRTPVDRAYAASERGEVIVGQALGDHGYRAFRWTEKTGMTSLGDSPGYQHRSDARAVTPDGAIIVGSAQFDQDNSDSRACRWTESDGFVDLGRLPGGGGRSLALDLTPDAGVIVGWALNQQGAQEAFRWTADDGMLGLGDLPGGRFRSYANAVSLDGTLIVGFSESGGNASREAFIWDQQHGMRLLSDVLQNDYGLHLTGWKLDVASGMSSDGTTIVGWGVNPNGDFEGWIATIPEPTTGLLVVLAAASAGRIRRRTASIAARKAWIFR